MRLEVDSATIRPQDTGGVTAAGAYGSHSRAGVSNTGSSDSAQVSGTSQLLNSLSAERSSRIQQLSAAVRSGTYNVSSAAIGKALIGESAAQGSAGGRAAG